MVNNSFFKIFFIFFSFLKIVRTHNLYIVRNKHLIYVYMSLCESLSLYIYLIIFILLGINTKTDLLICVMEIELKWSAFRLHKNFNSQNYSNIYKRKKNLQLIRQTKKKKNLGGSRHSFNEKVSWNT